LFPSFEFPFFEIQLQHSFIVSTCLVTSLIPLPLARFNPSTFDVRSPYISHLYFSLAPWRDIRLHLLQTLRVQAQRPMLLLQSRRTFMRMLPIITKLSIMRKRNLLDASRLDQRFSKTLPTLAKVNSGSTVAKTMTLTATLYVLSIFLRLF
jgi:hypothetical protein